MQRAPGLLRRLGRRSPTEVLLLGEALMWLILVRAAMSAVPFRYLIAALRLRAGEAGPARAGQARRAGAVGWAVRVAVAHTPWRSACLAQALAATAMLRWRLLPATLYLGVDPDVSDRPGIAAHAWVRCGDAVVTGAAEQADFAPLAAFCPRGSRAA